MPSKVELATALANAKVKVRRKREQEAIEARERLLLERLLAKVELPIAKDGKDGTDAPTLQEILEAIEIPAPIHQTTTVVQEVNPTDMEVFIRGLLPEIQPEDRPAVEQIVQEVTPEHPALDGLVHEDTLEGFVSQKEFKDALRRIQDAISASQSGGSPVRELPKVIEVLEDMTITSVQLDPSKYNIILIKTAGITVTLPAPSDTVLVEVKQGFVGTGTYTICRE